MFRLIEGAWRRSDVVVLERCYTPDEIDSALRPAGFGESSATPRPTSVWPDNSARAELFLLPPGFDSRRYEASSIAGARSSAYARRSSGRPALHGPSTSATGTPPSLRRGGIALRDGFLELPDLAPCPVVLLFVPGRISCMRGAHQPLLVPEICSSNPRPVIAQLGAPAPERRPSGRASCSSSPRRNRFRCSASISGTKAACSLVHLNSRIP